MIAMNEIGIIYKMKLKKHLNEIKEIGTKFIFDRQIAKKSEELYEKRGDRYSFQKLVRFLLEKEYITDNINYEEKDYECIVKGFRDSEIQRKYRK